MKRGATFFPPVILRSGVRGEEENEAHTGPGAEEWHPQAEDRMPRTGSANRDICSPADDVSLGFRERRVETRG